MNIKLKQIDSILLTLTTTELVLGGSGRFLEVGNGLTFRMIMTVIALLYAFFMIVVKKAKIGVFYFYILLFFVFTLVISTLIGFSNTATSANLFEDIKQYLFFPMIIFFRLTITDSRAIKRIVDIIIYSSFIMVVLYLLVLLSIQFGFINFVDLYEYLAESDQFIFRNDSGSFLYKGFLYLCISFFFLFLRKDFRSKLLSSLVFLGITLTFTRGFVLTIAIILVPYFIIVSFLKRNIGNLILVLSIFLSIPFYVFWFLDSIGTKDESDSIRIDTFNQVLERIDIRSLFIGHGFGIGVPIREIHMENSYLEVFHKQGILGLLFWLVLIFVLVINFIRCYRLKQNFSGDRDLSNNYELSFLFSGIFVVLQSLSNPFINNPIGMSIFLISIISLEVIANEYKQKLNFFNSSYFIESTE